MDVYSTRDAAKKLGIHLVTLQRYLVDRTVIGPAVTRVGGVQVRLWNDADIQRAKKSLPKITNGRKTRYQKRKDKQKTQPRAPQPQHAKTARAGGPGAALPKKRRTKKKK